jgi:hypothetical protein
VSATEPTIDSLLETAEQRVVRLQGHTENFAPEEPQQPAGRPCWAAGCAGAQYLVSNPAAPLVSPLATCREHLGDLLGNLTKAALDSGASSVRPEVLPLG